MNDTTLFQAAMVLYMFGTGAFLYEMVSKRSPEKKSIALWIVWFGFLVHTAGLIYRWVASYAEGYGHAPMTNRYESFIFFAWSIIGMYLLLEKRLKLQKLGGFIVPLAATGIAITAFMPGVEEEVRPLMPALKSNWLLFHVTTCFLAYSAFAVAFVAGIIRLMKKQKAVSESGANLDNVMYNTVMVGFLLLTVGIISGSAWAYNAWGRYWGWDPKEVWSLITWIVYAIFLHARVTKNWSGKRLAWISILGFIFVLFTFVGVNYLPIFKGLHSYA